MNYIEEIRELKQLFDDGIITEKEFNDKKTALLSSNVNKVKTKTEKSSKIFNKFNLQKILNIFNIVVSIALIVFICLSRVMNYQYIGKNYYYVVYTALGFHGIKKAFTIIALCLASVSLIGNILNLFIKNKLFSIAYYVLMVVTVAFCLLSSIFNIVSYAYVINILALVFSGLLTLSVVAGLLYMIFNRNK